MKDIHIIVKTNKGPIESTLFASKAPATVANFLNLASRGYYDGLKFHRVIKNFMIQGGDPTGTGTGGPGYQLKSEFNARKHVRGVLSMARSQNPHSAGSQFFVMHADSPFLDGQYTAFGMTKSGLEVVDKIVSLPTDGNDRPRKPPTIKKVLIEEK
jgi:peptidyl-prolyl cis-trans isomerase B (cyclophilin B)